MIKNLSVGRLLSGAPTLSSFNHSRPGPSGPGTPLDEVPTAGGLLVIRTPPAFLAFFALDVPDFGTPSALEGENGTAASRGRGSAATARALAGLE